MKTFNKFFSEHLKWLFYLGIFILIFLSLESNSFAKEQYAYIANTSNKIVTIVDLDNLTKRNLLLGFDLYYLKKIPGYDQLWIYNTEYWSGYLKVIDPLTGTLLHESTYENLGGLAVSSDGTRVFVAYGTNPVQISVLSTDDFTEIRNFVPLGLIDLQDIVLSKNGQIIYAVFENNFFIINANDGNLINVIPLNQSAYRIVISPKEDYAYVYGNYYYLTKINLKTFEVKTVTTNRDINALAISQDGRKLYIAFDYESKVSVFNAESLTMISSFSIGSQNAADLKVSSDDILLYVLNQNNPNFEIYECLTGRRKAGIYTGSGSYDFDFDYPPSDSIKPQPVSNFQVLKIYNDGALLSWTAASDDSSTEHVRGYEVRFDTVAIADINQAKIYPQSLKPSLPGQTDSLQINGLKEKTNYWVAVRSYDEAKNFSDFVMVDLMTLDVPQIAVSPDSFAISVSIGDTVKKSLTITNVAGIEAGALDFKILMSSASENRAQFAYVANPNSGTISIIDLLHANKKLLPTEYKPYKVIKSPLTNDLWIIDQDKRILFLCDLSTGKTKNAYSFENIKEFLLSPDGTQVFILYGSYQTWIKVYNIADMTEVVGFQVSTNYNSYSFAISSNGKYLYTMDGDYFCVFNALNGKKISSNRLNISRPQFIEISPDDKYAYLCSENNLSQLDLVNFTTKSNSIGSQVSAFDLSADGEKLFLGFNYGTSVAIYSTRTLTQSSSISVNHDQVTAVKVSPDMKYLYVLHLTSPNFEIYDLNTGNQLGSFTTDINTNTYGFDVSETTSPYLQIEPMVGTINGGKSKEVNLTLYSQYLFHNNYTSYLIIKSNDPANPTIKIPYNVNAQDTKGPDFKMSFFINPYLTNYLKVLVFSQEILPEFPTLTANNATLAMVIQDSVHYIYRSNYQLTTSEDITFSLTGADSVGNVSTLQRQLRVKNVLLAKASLLATIDRTLTIKLPTESFDQDRLVILWEEQDSESLEPIYHVGPEFLPLKNSARVEVDYSNIKIGNTDPHHLSIYQKDIHDQWEKLESYIDQERKVIFADIDRLGTFKVGCGQATFSKELAYLPVNYDLQQNYPNPFNPATTISYALPEHQWVTLKIYDILGREVVTLVDESQEAGDYQVPFSAENLASGIYFIHLKAGNFNSTKKMILMK